MQSSAGKAAEKLDIEKIREASRRITDRF